MISNVTESEFKHYVEIKDSSVAPGQNCDRCDLKVREDTKDTKVYSCRIGRFYNNCGTRSIYYKYKPKYLDMLKELL
jgi:hypothetical protein